MSGLQFEVFLCESRQPATFALKKIGGTGFQPVQQWGEFHGPLYGA